MIYTKSHITAKKYSQKHLKFGFLKLLEKNNILIGKKTYKNQKSKNFLPFESYRALFSPINSKVESGTTIG